MLTMSTLLLISFSLLFIDAIKSQYIDDIDLGGFTITNGTFPNIIFILTDDWGYNDVGWTNENTDTLTPYLDNLAKTEGLILTNYYAERVCTASRASFLTGRYPSHLGLQSGVCAPNQPSGLTRQVSMLSNEFQSAGYSTHMIGKWHLGMMSYEYTPTYRGFDSFYGFWCGGEDYYSHRSWSFMRQIEAGDLFINEKPALFQWGNQFNHPYEQVYGVWWQKAETLKLLQSKVLFPDKTAPFFFYFAMQASHSPRQAPDEYMALYKDGPFYDNHNRLTFMAQTTTADDAIRDIVEYMKRSGLWDTSLVVIGSDNGAKRHFGDNAPFRGFKNTSWEGGVKVPGFVTGGFLAESQRGKVMDYPMHFVDWYPTLLSAAGLDINYERSTRLYEIEENYDPLLKIFKEDTRWDEIEETELDGIDMWEYINGEVQNDEYFENEREILLDLKEVWCPFSSCGAIRVGQYKFIRGNNIASLLPDHDDGDKWFRGYVKDETKAEDFCNFYDKDFEEVHLNGGVREEFIIQSTNCVNTKSGCLFDLKLDPCEYYDLSSVYPDIVHKLEMRLDDFQNMATVPLMGENNANELFGREIIEPIKVCHNKEYWCPFKHYKDVEWENKLSFYKANVGNNNNGAGDMSVSQIKGLGLELKEWIIYVGVPALIVVLCVGIAVYFCVCRNREKDKELHLVGEPSHDFIDESDIIEDISEVQPLNGNTTNTTTMMAKINNVDIFDGYGATCDG